MVLSAMDEASPIRARPLLVETLHDRIAGVKTPAIIQTLNRLVEQKCVTQASQQFLAEDGEDALAKVAERKVDLITLDIRMPNMDGFQFLKTIKEENLLKNSKVIILTNLGQKEDIKKGLELGAHDYIVKAYFTPSEIVKKINSLLEAKK